jgi:hypothetical protein
MSHLVKEICARLRHIDTLDEVPGARAALPQCNVLWDAAALIEREFGSSKGDEDDRRTETHFRQISTTYGWAGDARLIVELWAPHGANVPAEWAARVLGIEL